MTKLSVNINKIATLRNARGGNTPSVIEAAQKCQQYGAQGITVHPRPDERHITRKDAYELKEVVYTEYNIEGRPTDEFMQMVLEIVPDQVTLVPDAEDAITSNAGWNTIEHLTYLSDIIKSLNSKGIRTSIFLDPKIELVESAAKTGADRIELYTEQFAIDYAANNKNAAKSYIETAQKAKEYGMGINAGHDLSLDNIAFLKKEIPFMDEVSIGHALISEALYLGLENTIQLYLNRLQN